MRLWIKVLVVVLICLIGIGIYRGWFSVSRQSADMGSDKVNVNVSVDKGKIRSDVKKAKEKVKEEVQELEGKVKAEKGK